MSPEAVRLTLHSRVPSPAPQFTLYYREGCHLCETMLRALRGLQSRLAFELTLVDIDRDPGLRRRYDEWVPVLADGEREICHYYLDEQALTDRLDGCRV